MNSLASPPRSVAVDHLSSSQSPHRPADADFKQLVASAFTILEQSPPPTLREILGAYRSKGDGDRDMLLAMLNAKAAEDKRLASVASLHRAIIEVYQTPSQVASLSNPPLQMNGSHHYPTPAFTQSPHLYEQKLRRSHHHHHQQPCHRATSRSRSPPPRSYYTHSHLSSARDAPPPPHVEPSRKRHRASASPSNRNGYYEAHSGSQHEQLPPSPYSSSGRSDSAEYSPRSRTSMAIGSLLSAGPSQEAATED